MEKSAKVRLRKRGKVCSFEKKLKEVFSTKPKEINNLRKVQWITIGTQCNRLIGLKERDLYFRILMHLHRMKCKKLLITPAYLRALAKFCFYSDEMIRGIETWKKESHHAEKQFQSLVRHFFAKFEIPVFFDAAWFAEVSQHQLWYIEVAQGSNIRKCENLPIEMSKKMSFYFMNAPARLSILQAFKWAQLMIIGGDAYLANQFIQCDMSSAVAMPQIFWESAVKFFSNNQRVSNEKLREVFDFLAAEIRQNPQFSLKGRSVSSLVKLSVEWHMNIVERSVEYQETRLISWEKNKYIFDWDFVDKGSIRTGKPKGPVKKKKFADHYKVVELLDSIQLQEEGRRMHHCVGGYAHACQKGRSAIFSIRLNCKSLATIEVNLIEHKVVQAKGVCNQKLNQEAVEILLKWAGLNNLKIGQYL